MKRRRNMSGWMRSFIPCKEGGVGGQRKCQNDCWCSTVTYKAAESGPRGFICAAGIIHTYTLTAYACVDETFSESPCQTLWLNIRRWNGIWRKTRCLLKTAETGRECFLLVCVRIGTNTTSPPKVGIMEQNWRYTICVWGLHWSLL